MQSLVKIFFTGMLVSFIGSLPLGTLNIAAMQISIASGVISAMWFSLGSLLVEIFYVRLSLVGMDWVRKQEKLLRMLEWITLIIVVALAASSFYAALHPAGNTGNIILNSKMPTFLLGATMCAVNPVQIPFWFGWSTVLFTKNILLPRPDHYNGYILGIGIGTFLGNCVFIFGGLLIASRISNNSNIINWVVGGIFALTAIIQLIRIVRKKDAVHKIEHPDEVKEAVERQFFKKKK